MAIIIITILDLCLPLGASQGASPARQPAAAGKPSGSPVSGSEPGSQRYGGLVQEFFRNVCSSRGPGIVTLPVERAPRDSLGSFGGVGVSGGLGSVDEPKPECVVAGVGGHGALAGLGGGNDNVTRIVNKRFMRQTAGEEMVNILGGGKETMSNAGAAGSGTEVRPLEMCFNYKHKKGPYQCFFTLNNIYFTSQLNSFQTMDLGFRNLMYFFSTVPVEHWFLRACYQASDI